MKIIHTTKETLEKKHSFKRVYCCKKLMRAMTTKEISGFAYAAPDRLYPNFTVVNEKVMLETHTARGKATESQPIGFCPFCGTTLTVEHINKPYWLKPNPVKKPYWLKVKKIIFWQRYKGGGIL